MRAEKRALGILICAVLVLTLLFSSVYTVRAANHACCGERCLVCRTIARAERVLRGLVVLLASAAAMAAAALLCRAVPADETRRGFACATPVQWKIRLND